MIPRQLLHRFTLIILTGSVLSGLLGYAWLPESISPMSATLRSLMKLGSVLTALAVPWGVGLIVGRHAQTRSGGLRWGMLAGAVGMHVSASLTWCLAYTSHHIHQVFSPPGMFELPSEVSATLTQAVQDTLRMHHLGGSAADGLVLGVVVCGMTGAALGLLGASQSSPRASTDALERVAPTSLWAPLAVALFAALYTSTTYVQLAEQMDFMALDLDSTDERLSDETNNAVYSVDATAQLAFLRGAGLQLGSIALLYAALGTFAARRRWSGRDHLLGAGWSLPVVGLMALFSLELQAELLVPEPFFLLTCMLVWMPLLYVVAAWWARQKPQLEPRASAPREAVLDAACIMLIVGHMATFNPGQMWPSMELVSLQTTADSGAEAVASFWTFGVMPALHQPLVFLASLVLSGLCVLPLHGRQRQTPA